MSIERSWNRSKYEKPEPEKKPSKVKFYSKVGKKTLQNIWTAEDLDQENFYSSWIEYGPSITLTNEIVSDFIHAYLQVKNKTLVAMHHAFKARCKAVESFEMEEFYEMFGCEPTEQEPYYFQVHAGASQAVYDAVMEERMAKRRKIETLRIKKLVINRKLNPPPNFKHPVLNLNILNERLAALQKLEKTNKKRLRYGELPVITHYDGSKLFRKKKKDKKVVQQDNDDDIFMTLEDESDNQSSTARVPIKYIDEETTKISVDHSRKLSSIALSPTQQIYIATDEDRSEEERMFENSEFEELSSIWEREDDYSRNYSSDIDDLEIFTEAEQYYFYGTSGHVEFTKHFPYLSPIIDTAIQNAQNAQELFEEATEIISVFRRQLAAAKSSLTQINRVYHPF